jgi:hypothetical protein
VIPDSTGVISLADQNTDGVNELYRVLFGGGGSTRLNPGLIAGRNVLSYAISPNSGSVVYRANQDNVNIVELFRTFFASAGGSTKLNSTLVVGQDVTEFAVR